MTRFFLIACMLATWAAAANGARHQLHAELDSPSPSPSPSISAECSTLIYNMASCLPVLSDGGNETKPDSACCSGFESVVKGNAECVCEALRSSSGLGVKLNISKAMALPSVCGLSATLISECDISPPAPSPGMGYHLKSFTLHAIHNKNVISDTHLLFVEPPVSPPKTPANPSAPEPSSGGELTPAPSADTVDQAPAPSSGGELTPASSTNTGSQSPAPSPVHTGSQSPAPSPVHGGAYSTSASFTVVIISLLVASFSTTNISV